MTKREQDIGVERARGILGKLVDAAALDRVTSFLTRRGRRVAAIVPINDGIEPPDRTFIRSKVVDELWSRHAREVRAHLDAAVAATRAAQLDHLRAKLRGFGLDEAQVEEAVATAEWSTVQGVEWSTR